MSESIISNGLTDSDRELLYGDAKKKNNIDEKYYIHITKKMMDIFTDHCELQPINIFVRRDAVEFQPVAIENRPLRKLTQEEYEAFPDKDKNFGLVIKKAFFSNVIPAAIAVVFLTAWAATVKIARESGVLFITTAFMIFGVVLFFIFFFSEMKRLKQRLITSESKAAFGNVILFRSVPIAGGDAVGSAFYIDVAFYDEGQILKKVI